MNRREFLKLAGRWSVLGILGYAGLKGVSHDVRFNDRCLSNGICKDCSRLNGCQHPSALSYKQSK